MPPTKRPGLPNSGEVTVTQADGTDPQTVLDLPDDRLFEAHQLVVEYDPAASVTTELTIHDDDAGTSNANLSTRRKTVKNLTPGEVRAYDDLSMRDFENDVLVAADNNQDDDIVVYVDGKDITSGLSPTSV